MHTSSGDSEPGWPIVAFSAAILPAVLVLIVSYVLVTLEARRPEASLERMDESTIKSNVYKVWSDYSTFNDINDPNQVERSQLIRALRTLPSDTRDDLLLDAWDHHQIDDWSLAVGLGTPRKSRARQLLGKMANDPEHYDFGVRYEASLSLELHGGSGMSHLQQ